MQGSHAKWSPPLPARPQRPGREGVDCYRDRLAFGSTTGPAWVSEDGGESWQILGEHLPPVYTVRFVP